MSITLTAGAQVITLSPDLRWSDENNWNPVAQAVARTLTGALDIQASAMQKGRPITLEPEDDSSAWMTSAVVEQLRNLAAVPAQEMLLTLRGITRAVIFRHQDGGLEARPVAHFRDRLASDWYLCVIRLMEI